MIFCQGFEYDYLPDINVYSNRFDIPDAYERTIKCRMLYKKYMINDVI